MHLNCKLFTEIFHSLDKSATTRNDLPLLLDLVLATNICNELFNLLTHHIFIHQVMRLVRLIKASPMLESFCFKVRKQPEKLVVQCGWWKTCKFFKNEECKRDWHSFTKWLKVECLQFSNHRFFPVMIMPSWNFFATYWIQIQIQNSISFDSYLYLDPLECTYPSKFS